MATAPKPFPLDANGQKYALLLEKLGVVVGYFDCDARVVFLNQKGLSYLNVPLSACVGKSVVDVFGREFGEAVAKRIAWAIEENRDIFFPDLALRFGDKEFWFSATYSPIRDESGECTGVQVISQDVTNIIERKKAEDELRRQKEILQTILDNVPVALVFFDPNKQLVYVNKYRETLLGWSLEDLQHSADHFAELYPDPDVRRQALAFIRSSGRVWRDFRVQRRDGGILDISWWNMAFSDGSSVGIGVDVTERKRSEQALLESEEKYRLVVEATNDTFYDWDVLRQKVIYGPRWAELIEVSADRVEQWHEPWDRRVHPEDNSRVQALLRAHLAGESGYFEAEFRIYRESGEWRWVLGKGRVVARDGHGGPVRVTGTLSDIEPRKKAELQLLEYQEQLRSLAQNISMAEERERHRIASGLHDSVAQMLAACNMKCGAAQAMKDRDQQKALLDEISSLLGQAVSEVRSMLFDLSPPVLYELGFVPAIEWLADTFQQQWTLPMRVEAAPDFPPLHLDTRVFLFRVVRELLLNVMKHAGAAHVVISLAREQEGVKIVVQDDGVGFDPAELHPDPKSTIGFGLFLLKERLRWLNGTIDIQSKLRVGTKVIVRVP